MVDKGKHLCINLLQLINENKITLSEHHYCAAPHELLEDQNRVATEREPKEKKIRSPPSGQGKASCENTQQ